MVRLRGHHLICLHFFQGEGYEEGFVENLRNVMARMGGGEEIEVVAVADDICCSCPWLVGDRCTSSDKAEEEIRELDNAALDCLGLAAGERILWEEIKNKVNLVPKAWYSSFCEGCEWERICAPRQGR